MSENPFIRKAKLKAPAPGPTSHTGPTPKRNPFLEPKKEAPPRKKRNPFLDAKEKPKAPKRMTEDEWEALRAEARLIIQQKGIKVGDEVEVTWEVDGAYGGGTRTHTGTVKELNDWIVCEPFSTSNGLLRMPLTAVSSIKRFERKKKANPFMASSS